MTKRALLMLIVLWVSGWATDSAEAAVCNVPADYGIIQDALDDASCSEIIIAAGYYVGPDIDLNVTRTLTMRGAGQTGGITIATYLNYRVLVTNDAVVTLESLAIDGLGPSNGVELSSTAAGVIGNNITIYGSLGWGIDNTFGVSTSNTFATLSNCTIYGNAGGVNVPTLTMSRCDVYSNNRFGGITVSKTGTISHSSIYTNQQDNAVYDGAGVLFNSFVLGTLLIEFSSIYDNETHIDPNVETIDGGGVMVRRGHATIRHSGIYDNQAAGRGGGIAVHNVFDASLVLEGSSVRNNTAYYGGGGVSAGNQTTINNSHITENIARYDANFNLGGFGAGGGVFVHGEDPVSITDATISHNGTAATTNMSVNSGGGIYIAPNFTDSTVTVQRSIIHDNYAIGDGGGVHNNGNLIGPDENLTLSNTTIVDNWANGDGGGIHNGAGVTFVNNSTIVGNSADHEQNGSGDGGGIAGFVIVNHTLIAHNSSTTPEGQDCSGGISQGYSLLRIGNGCPAFKQTGTDFIGDLNSPFDPQIILPHKNYGGATNTIALKRSSPAIDAGDVLCNDATVDQRHASRVGQDGNGDGGSDGDRCDIGAFESESTPPPPPTAVTLQTQSTETSTDLVVIFLLFGGAAAGLIWWATRCPNCNRPLAKQVVKQNRSLGQFFAGKAHRHYRCTHCGHEWDKVVYIDE